ncbi:hypothetical protein L596_017665 [Steinernema carpocapsae]|uniref:Uncharacterized protein n=1 Tax=Steinernema carpocapsae TaxID=34508 RepID=A0A4U5N320_STECR|nr:hypothetical protein L596_017665 [Steinernema carpocapsae]
MRARASRRPQGRSNKSGSSLLASSSRVSSTPRVLRSSQNRARMFTTTKMIMRKFFFLFVLLLPYACAQKEGPKGPLTNDFVVRSYRVVFIDGFEVKFLFRGERNFRQVDRKEKRTRFRSDHLYWIAEN